MNGAMNYDPNTQTADASPVQAGAASVAVKRKIVGRVLLVLLCAGCVAYITLLSRSVSLTRKIIAMPLHSWRAWLSGNGQTGRGILENIALFVPFGYLTASLFSVVSGRKKRGAACALLAGFLFSLAIEALQYYSGRGTLEFDDLLNNVLGTLLGLLAYRAAAAVGEKKCAGRAVLYGVLPALMLLACLAGCLRMRDRVVMTNLRTDQFWFSVDQVQGSEFRGRCHVYDGETPEYRIFLVRGLTAHEAEVTKDGEGSFTARMKEPAEGKYELRVRFRGYPAMSAGVYLNGDRVEYVDGEVPVPADADGKPLLPGAVLKACSEELGCYVFQDGTDLIWLFSPDIAPATELICHIRTGMPELLPELSKPYGFENRGFHASDVESSLGAYRCAVRPLPTEYPIISVTVGLNPGGKVIWNAAFRP